MSPKEKINYRRAFKFLFPFIKSRKDKFIKLILIFSFASILRLLIPVVIKRIIDNAILSGNKKYLIFAGCVYLILNIVYFLMSYFGLFYLIKTSQHLIYEIKNKLYKHIAGLDIDYFVKNNPGRIGARIQNDTNAVYDLFSEFALSIFVDIGVFVAIFFIMAYHSFTLTLILFPTVISIFFVVYFFVKKSQSVFLEVRRKIANLTSHISEFINLLGIIKLHRSENFVLERFDKSNFDKFLKTVSAEYIAILFFLIILLFDPISKSAIFGYGGLSVLENKLTIGTLVMFMLYISQLFEPLFRFTEYVSIFQKSFASVERINQIFLIQPSIQKSGHIIEGVESIVFDDVWMQYPNTNEWVLKGLSFNLKKGNSLAIVGRTGEGKTTITNLILRFYEYQKGSILINGKDIRTIDIMSIRRHIGLVQQDMYLFPSSLRDNIRLMDTRITDQKIISVIKTLGIEDFLRKYPLDFMILEKGANISTGEKQIISLIRALVLEQEVIILDEATSNVDPYTEQLITSAIKKIMKQKTMIIIAHRLSTVENADYIGFLKDGRFVEFGNHNYLMSLKGNYYNYWMLYG